MSTLAQEHARWGNPHQREIDWLVGQGVPILAVGFPWAVGACGVRFDGSLFEVDENGDRAFTIAVIDAGEIVDIAAWQPRTGRIATYLGRGFALGQDHIFNPATYADLDVGGGALHVHETPLEWLRHSRCGIVILQRELAHAYLADCPALAVDDPAFGHKLKGWIAPPPPKSRIFVRQPVEAVA